MPAEAKGEEILMPARLVNLADVVEVYHRTGGVDAAVAVARERSGTQFDPALVDVFCADAPLLFSEIDSLTAWPAVIDAEPALEIVLSDDELESALEAIADFTDLKSPWTIGHSRGVADLARAAAEALRAVGRRRQRSCAGRGWCTTSVAWASPTRSGTSAARSPRRSSNGCACIRT